MFKFCNSCDGAYDSLDVRFTKACDNDCAFCIERNGINSLGAKIISEFPVPVRFVILGCVAARNVRNVVKKLRKLLDFHSNTHTISFRSLKYFLALWWKWLKRGNGFPAVIRRSGTEARNQRKLPEFDSRQGTNFLRKVLDI